MEAKTQPSAFQLHIYKEKQTPNSQSSVQQRENVPGGKSVSRPSRRLHKGILSRNSRDKYFQSLLTPRELEDTRENGRFSRLFSQIGKLPLKRLSCPWKARMKIKF